MSAAAAQPEPLAPFGVRLQLPPGTAWETLDPAWLDRLVLTHRVVVLRGLADFTRESMVAFAQQLGPIQGWRFGAIHELKVEPEANNYLYTTHAVPLHWDGAFADEAPAIMIFRCIEASAGAGGETLFVDTAAVCADASAAELTRWDRRIHLTTAEKAHYGGTVVRRMRGTHPDTGAPVLRFAEPVDDLNPVLVQLSGADGPAEIAALQARLHRPEYTLAHAWEPGDCVLADNRALLHGRNAFAEGAARYLWRVNVLGRRRPWWQPLRDAIAVRRPEFLPTEAAILLMAPALVAEDLLALATPRWTEALAIYLLLVGIGDIANCWADRDVDRLWKTHLSEAVARLGRRGIGALLGGSALLAVLLSVHVWWVWGAAWWVPAGTVVGLIGGAAYSVGPLPLKQQGWGQVLGYVLLLATGPVVLVGGAFVAWPSRELVLSATAFGVVQAGVMVLNSAEDLMEDRSHGLDTIASALGPERVLAAAALLVALGAGAVVAVTPAPLPHEAAYLALMGGVTAWMAWMAARMRGNEAELWDARIKKAAAWSPHLLALVAWATLLLFVAARSHP